MSSKQNHTYRRDRNDALVKYQEQPKLDDLYSHAKPLPHQSPPPYTGKKYITLEGFRYVVYRDEYRKTSPIVFHLLSKFKDKLKLDALLDDNFDPKVHGEIAGYYPQKDFVYFAYDLPAIEHEIAHMVEIDESKMLLPDWGLRMFSLGKETSSAIVAGMARESRVMGIQSHLFPKKEDGRSLSNNPIWADYLFDRCPFGRFKTKMDIINWLDDMYEKTQKNWCLDKIEALWNKRVDIVLNWMEMQ